MSAVFLTTGLLQDNKMTKAWVSSNEVMRKTQKEEMVIWDLELGFWI